MAAVALPPQDTVNGRGTVLLLLDALRLGRHAHARSRSDGGRATTLLALALLAGAPG